jgi:formylglycine-generating enzyme required for sulfatase activity
MQKSYIVGILVSLIGFNQLNAEHIHKIVIIKSENCGSYITPALTKVHKGSFKMISRFGESNESPATKVFIDKDFYTGVYEVTFEEYDKFCEDTNRPKPSDEGWSRGKRPVINVSWYDAKDYVKWLSEKTKEDYRLPSEIQWEYLARSEGQHNGKWCFGDNKDEFGDYAWSRGNSNGTTHIVGQKRPNHIGIYDIHGNVWEWCDSTYINNINIQTKFEPELNSGEYRVLRGGSLNNFAVNLLLAFRYGYPANDKSKLNGFRVIKMEN